MNKQVERIRSLVEESFSLFSQPQTPYEAGKAYAYKSVLSLIDNLQEEPVHVTIGEPKEATGVLAKLIKESEANDWKKPASEDLKEASKEWLEPQLDKSYAIYGEGKMMELTHFNGYAMLNAIEFGTKWQEQQLEKNRLARCDAQTEEEAEREQEFVMQHIKKYHCQPTFSDAIEWGMNRQREQMMNYAVEGNVCFDYYSDDNNTYGYIDNTVCLENLGLKDKDRVKLIIVKED